MISALQVDLRLLFDAVVDDRIDRVAFADRRNGTRRAIIEQLFNFILRCQIDV